MKKILVSAFACEPNQGSEPGYGWNWSIELAKAGYEVHTLTLHTYQSAIENEPVFNNLHFHYVNVPRLFVNFYNKSTLGMYLYYLLWQWEAYIYAKKIHIKYKFDIIHHVTWGNVQLGSFLYKINIPFIFGPAGGGQKAPPIFKKYFFKYWNLENKREAVSILMRYLNPAFKNMVKKASAVLVSNPDTEKIVRKAGAKYVVKMLDTALPDSFFPSLPKPINHEQRKIKLLWVGRFLPRKGIMLLLDVMNSLKSYPEITLTVVGDGIMRDVFLDTIEKYDLKSSVTWEGAVPYDQITNYYQSHDIFIFTSLRESGGVQLIEAMAYSLPVITLNLHGPSIIVDNSRGIKCDCITPVQTIKALVDAVLFFYNNYSQIKIRGDQAYRFAKDQTWNNKVRFVTSNLYNDFL